MATDFETMAKTAKHDIHVHFPAGNGLGVKLHDKLFQPGQREYRKSC